MACRDPEGSEFLALAKQVKLPISHKEFLGKYPFL